MKYYIGEILEINGGMEYETKYLFATKRDTDKYTDKVAMKWRGGSKRDWSDSDDAYWSDCTLIRDQGATEITEQDFDVLKKYLSVL